MPPHAVSNPNPPVEAEVDLSAKDPEKLADPKNGFSDSEVKALREKYGFNEVVPPKTPVWKQILMRYLQLVPIIIIITAILSVAIEDDLGKRDYVSFGLLLFELNLVVFVDWYGERNAGKAVEVLQKMAAPSCHAKRNGKWVRVPVRELVPGDLIQLVIGAVLPADARLTSHSDPVQLDEASLTGEALPVTKYAGDECLSGAVVATGEAEAYVIRTGENTFFGKTISLVSSVQSEGSLQKILKKVARVIAGIGAVFVVGLFFHLLFDDNADFKAGEALKLSFVILTAVVPIALPIVVTTTLFVGSRELSDEKAIVTRLSGIESLAGMSVLCSDKTGTLTLNKLTMHEPWFPDTSKTSEEEMYIFAALASKQEEGQDAIDLAITRAVVDPSKLERYQVLSFMPFNPVDKRTEARVRDTKTGKVFRVSKGAPHVIRDLAAPVSLKPEVDEAILEFASRGLRALGLCIAEENAPWQFIGLFSIFDPPRADTKDTIQRAMDLGVRVIMITGDAREVAIEVARQLNLGTSIMGTEIWDRASADELSRLVDDVAGFAGVYPEHKFAIVDSLQKKGQLVAMTGDGVNDAPALKKADVGISVAGATDAAQAASDIILTQPGLSTIVTAILLARKIFKRLQGYVIYRLASSVLILLFFFLSIVALDFFMPTWTLILISLVNDFTVMATSKDYVIGAKRPETWDMVKVISVALIIGIPCVASSFLFLFLASPQYEDWWHIFDIGTLTEGELVAAVFLQLNVSIQFNILSTRTEGFFFSRRPSALVACSVAFGMLFSTFLAVYWPDDVTLGGNGQMAGAGWSVCLIVIVYDFVWFLIGDTLKVMFYRAWEKEVFSPIHEMMERMRLNRRATSGRDLRQIMNERDHKGFMDARDASRRRTTSMMSLEGPPENEIAKLYEENQKLQATVAELQNFQKNLLRYMARDLDKEDFLRLYPS